MQQKIIRIKANAKREEYAEISKLKQEGKAKWLYYAIDGDISYFYYLIY